MDSSPSSTPSPCQWCNATYSSRNQLFGHLPHCHRRPGKSTSLPAKDAYDGLSDLAVARRLMRQCKASGSWCSDDDASLELERQRGEDDAVQKRKPTPSQSLDTRSLPVVHERWLDYATWDYHTGPILVRSDTGETRVVYPPSRRNYGYGPVSWCDDDEPALQSLRQVEPPVFAVETAFTTSTVGPRLTPKDASESSASLTPERDVEAKDEDSAQRDDVTSSDHASDQASVNDQASDVASDQASDQDQASVEDHVFEVGDSEVYVHEDGFCYGYDDEGQYFEYDWS